MGFGQMGFNRQMPGVFQKPETSTSGFQKPDSSNQFQPPETSMASSDNVPEKLTAIKKKDKQSTPAQKTIGPKTDSQPATSQAVTSQAQVQGTPTTTSQPGIVKTANPVMQPKPNMMIPFAKVSK